MKIDSLHSWNLETEDARRLQLELAGKVIQEDRFSSIKTVGGVDIGVSGGEAHAACVVMSFPELEVVDCAVSSSPTSFPYVPGLLSFREIPALIPALEKLKVDPDLMLVDGQGLAHPRRFGLASHLGVLCNKPSIGCAKSKLFGSFREPGPERGSMECLYDGEVIIGMALRTRDHVKPLFVSVGHNISLYSAVRFVLQCCTRYRLPEPVRFAHNTASGYLPW